MGIGSKLKRFVRKVIPNEAAELAVKAAPFVAPFNPAIAAAMAGIGSFDQTGRIGSSVKAGLGTYAMGQGARMLGGAGFQKGFGGGGGLGSYFTSPFSGGQLFGSVGAQGPVDPIFGGTGETKFFTGGDSNLNRLLGDASSTANQSASNAITEGGQSVLQPDGTVIDSATGNVISEGGKLVSGTSETGTLAKLLNPDISLMDKGKIINDFMTDPNNKFLVSALGGTATAIAQYFENKANEEATKNDFRTFAEMGDDTYNLQYVADGGPIVKEEKQLTAREGILGPTANGGRPLFDPEKMSEKYAQGGRIGFQDGGESNYYIGGRPATEEEYNMQGDYMDLTPEGMDLFKAFRLENPDVDENIILDALKKQGYSGDSRVLNADGGRIGFQMGGGLFGGDVNYMQGNSAMADSPQYQAWENIYSQNPDQAAMFPDHLAFKQLYETENKADGGRIGFRFGGGDFSDQVKQIDLDREMDFLLRVGQAHGPKGSRELEKQAIDNIQSNALDLFYEKLKNGGLAGYFNGGRVDLALGGGPNREPDMEMDLRPGGFIPVGIAERADDVPARVSKNEFVMTADAVRAAGGGSVDKGAQVMYDLMNRLEGQA